MCLLCVFITAVPIVCVLLLQDLVQNFLRGGVRIVEDMCYTRRGAESDSQHFKSLRRGVLRAFWDLKAENGVFFRTEVFLDSTFSFFS